MKKWLWVAAVLILGAKQAKAHVLPPPSPNETYATSATVRGVGVTTPGLLWTIDLRNERTGATVSRTIPYPYGFNRRELTLVDFPNLQPNTRFTLEGRLSNGVHETHTFYTRPMEPGAQNSPQILSCSAVQVSFRNSADSGVSNPVGTQYLIEVAEVLHPSTLVTASVSSALGQASEVINITVSGLKPSMAYTVRVRALNEGRAVGWLDSGSLAMGTITTPACSSGAQVQFEQSLYTVSENAGSAVVRVVRSGDLAVMVSGSMRLVSASAQAGVDTAAGPFPFSISPGAFQATVSVGVINDALAEGNEQLTLQLENLVNTIAGIPNNATLAILDDESSGGPTDPPTCGNGICSPTESCSSCVADCGICPGPGPGNPTKRLIISPRQATLHPGDTLPFTAESETIATGVRVPVTPQWSAEGSGVISGAGLLTATQASRTITVSAALAGHESDSVQVTVLAPGAFTDISQAVAYPVPYKSTMASRVITFKNLAPDTKVRIFTADSREVRSLSSVIGENIEWDVKNDNGERVASGVYFYILENPTTAQTKKGKLVIIQ